MWWKWAKRTINRISCSPQYFCLRSHNELSSGDSYHSSILQITLSIRSNIEIQISNRWHSLSQTHTHTPPPNYIRMRKPNRKTLWIKLRTTYKTSSIPIKTSNFWKANIYKCNAQLFKFSKTGKWRHNIVLSRHNLDT